MYQQYSHRATSTTDDGDEIEVTIVVEIVVGGRMLKYEIHSGAVYDALALAADKIIDDAVHYA